MSESGAVRVQILKDLMNKVFDDVVTAVQTPLGLIVMAGGPVAHLHATQEIARIMLKLSAAAWVGLDGGDPKAPVDDDAVLAVALLCVKHGVPAGQDFTDASARENLHRVQRQFRAVTGRELAVPRVLAEGLAL
jgi:hypothetical protein